MRILLLPGLLLSLSLGAETVYKSVDEEGNIIFSDQPSVGAEEIQVREPEVVTSEPQKLPAYEPARVAESLLPYTELAIKQPTHDTTVQSNPGNLQVAVSMSPDLLAAHQLQLEMDGKLLVTGKSKQFKLENIDRGTHELVVHVITAEGKKLISSDPVTVHLRRFSILSEPNDNDDNAAVTPLNPPRGSPEDTNVVPEGISPDNPATAQDQEPLPALSL